MVLIGLKFQPEVCYIVRETGLEPTLYRNTTASCVYHMSPCTSTADCCGRLPRLIWTVRSETCPSPLIVIILIILFQTRQDTRLSQQCWWGCKSSGMWNFIRCVVFDMSSSPKAIAVLEALGMRSTKGKHG